MVRRTAQRHQWQKRQRSVIICQWPPAPWSWPSLPPTSTCSKLAVACEVFGLDRRELSPHWYRFELIGERRRAESHHGVALDGLRGLDRMRVAHTVVIPGWPALERPPSAALLRAVKSAHRRGVRLVTFCSGAFLLAHAGLLDGLTVTTHWMYYERLKKRFPKVDVDPHPLYVRNGNIWTSAGTAAGVDLSLELVRQDFGASIANQVARRMVVSMVREGGQAQFIERPLPRDEHLERVMDWALARLEARIPVEVLAKQAGMSPRTFARKFLALSGTTPHAWLLSARLERARLMLEGSDLSVEEVARNVGLDAASLRLRFRERLGTSPLRYRRQFRRRGEPPQASGPRPLRLHRA